MCSLTDSQQILCNTNTCKTIAIVHCAYKKVISCTAKVGGHKSKTNVLLHVGFESFHQQDVRKVKVNEEKGKWCIKKTNKKKGFPFHHQPMRVYDFSYSNGGK